MKNDWIDFAQIKQEADVLAILKRLVLLDGLEQRGDELVGWCPLGEKGHGKRDSFTFNVSKKIFQCFACKNKGSILDFVARLEHRSLYDAGMRIQELMTVDDMPPDVMEQSPIPVAGHKEVDRDDNLQYLHTVMTFGQAVRYIKDGTLSPESVVVVDVGMLRVLHEATSGRRTADGRAV